MGSGKLRERRGLFLAGKLLAGLALWYLTAVVLALKGPHHAWDGIYLTQVILLVLFAKLLGRIPLPVSSCFFLLPALFMVFDSLIIHTSMGFQTNKTIQEVAK